MDNAKQLDSGIREPLLELRKRLAGMYGDRIADILLYGSRARGDAQADSDIDVLVVLKGRVDPGMEVHKTSELLADISLKYGVVITCVFIDESKYARGKGPLVRNVLKEGIRI
jgi:uncharacterized protein